MKKKRRSDAASYFLTTREEITPYSSGACSCAAILRCTAKFLPSPSPRRLEAERRGAAWGLFANILLNFRQISPIFFRDFSKMQHFSKKFERVGASPKFPRSFPELPRSFPDVLQFGEQPTPPTMRPFLAHAAPPGLIKPAALRDQSRLRSHRRTRGGRSQPPRRIDKQPAGASSRVRMQPTWGICTRRAGKLYKARSRLYRSQILQVNTLWKALAEIYTMHSFAPLWNRILLCTAL